MIGFVSYNLRVYFDDINIIIVIVNLTDDDDDDDDDDAVAVASRDKKLRIAAMSFVVN